ncbi:hypothetical protein [Cellulomonas triticagri]|uniref:Uncharacterized protein n=1 Tax=Cellulomonas triticagri TaxID=2483352 RepID=A0A3M2JMK2_9CELL|nr:hypothetical protein [Cellulomonas triticagri]RMI13040.1 hypothetical protein EBM89_06055 [Cellulomonas triticagri]
MSSTAGALTVPRTVRTSVVVALPWLVSATTVAVLLGTYAGLEAVGTDPDEDGFRRGLEQVFHGMVALAAAAVAWCLALGRYVRSVRSPGRRAGLWWALTAVAATTAVPSLVVIGAEPAVVGLLWPVQQALLSVTAWALHEPEA